MPVLAIDPQPQRRRRRARRDDRVVIVRPVIAQAFAQPRRPAGVGVDLRQSLALRASQQCIDQLGLVRATEQARGFHGRRDRRMRRQAERVELRESRVQQRAQFVIAFRQGLGHPSFQRDFGARLLAQGRKADRFNQCAVARIRQRGQCLRQFPLQRTAAIQHRGEHLGGDRTRPGSGRRGHRGIVRQLSDGCR